MKIAITGKHLKIGQELKQHITDKLNNEIKKYFENAISADVTFSREPHLFVADINVNEGTGTGIFVKSQAKEDDIFVSFDRALDKVAKQLRRYKRKIKSHDKLSVAEAASSFKATKYVISDDGQDMEDDNPLIIAEKQTSIENLTVADAVMRMNLSNLPALMFINKKTGHVNTVYRRLDGNISWVDSDIKAETINEKGKKAA
jgi:ribosomal subunit interface protein